MISIIIPTLDEEELLPALLENIKKQTFQDFEIIVADAGSKDRTVEIATKYGCRVVDGGLPGIGRNKGADVAKGDYFIFFDADVSINRDFIKKAFSEFQDRYLDIATSDIKPDSYDKKMKLIFEIYNEYARVVQFLRPSCGGFFMMMTRRLFETFGGFDESLKLAEDQEFVRRVSSKAKFRILDSVSLKLSVRRIEKEGMLKLIGKYTYSEFYQMVNGKIKEDIFEYEFANYENVSKKEKKDFLKHLNNLKEKIKKIKF